MSNTDLEYARKLLGHGSVRIDFVTYDKFADMMNSAAEAIRVCCLTGGGLSEELERLSGQVRELPGWMAVDKHRESLERPDGEAMATAIERHRDALERDALERPDRDLSNHRMVGSADLAPVLIKSMEYELAECRARVVQLEAEIASLRGERSGYEGMDTDK